MSDGRTQCAGISHARPLRTSLQRMESIAARHVTHGYLFVNHVPPTPAFLSYIVSSMFGMR